MQPEIGLAQKDEQDSSLEQKEEERDDHQAHDCVVAYGKTDVFQRGLLGFSTTESDEAYESGYDPWNVREDERRRTGDEQRREVQTHAHEYRASHKRPGYLGRARRHTRVCARMASASPFVWNATPEMIALDAEIIAGPTLRIRPVPDPDPGVPGIPGSSVLDKIQKNPSDIPFASVCGAIVHRVTTILAMNDADFGTPASPVHATWVPNMQMVWGAAIPNGDTNPIWDDLMFLLGNKDVPKDRVQAINSGIINAKGNVKRLLRTAIRHELFYMLQAKNRRKFRSDRFDITLAQIGWAEERVRVAKGGGGAAGRPVVPPPPVPVVAAPPFMTVIGYVLDSHLDLEGTKYVMNVIAAAPVHELLSPDNALTYAV